MIFPIDMIKSRIQTDGFSAETGQKYKSGIDAVKKVWKAEGTSAFTRGLVPILIRSVPAYLSLLMLTETLAVRLLPTAQPS